MQGKQEFLEKQRKHEKDSKENNETGVNPQKEEEESKIDIYTPEKISSWV